MVLLGECTIRITSQILHNGGGQSNTIVQSFLPLPQLLMKQETIDKIKTNAHNIYQMIKKHPGVKTIELENLLQIPQGYFSQQTTAAGKAFHLMLQHQIIGREKHKAPVGHYFYTHKCVKPLESLNEMLNDLTNQFNKGTLKKHLGLSNSKFWQKKGKEKSAKLSPSQLKKAVDASLALGKKPKSPEGIYSFPHPVTCIAMNESFLAVGYGFQIRVIKLAKLS